jgi:hypothetical protein
MTEEQRQLERAMLLAVRAWDGWRAGASEVAGLPPSERASYASGIAAFGAYLRRFHGISDLVYLGLEGAHVQDATTDALRVACQGRAEYEYLTMMAGCWQRAHEILSLPPHDYLRNL